MQTVLPFFQTGAAIRPEVQFSDIFHNIIPVGILLSFHSPVHLPLTVTQTDLPVRDRSIKHIPEIGTVLLYLYKPDIPGDLFLI